MWWWQYSDNSYGNHASNSDVNSDYDDSMCDDGDGDNNNDSDNNDKWWW